MLAYTELQTVAMAADGRDSYYIGDSPIVPDTMQVWVDDVEIVNTDMDIKWTIDLNTGLFLFAVGEEPDPEADILWRFKVTPWSEDMLTEAINSVINDCKDVFFVNRLNDEMFVGDGVTQEYELPDDCWFLREVYVATGTSWEREYDWVTFEGDGKVYIRFLGAIPTMAVRGRYVAAVNYLVDDDDILEPDLLGTDTTHIHANLAKEARDAILYGTCWRLVDQSLLPRARNNVFLNAEGQNYLRTIDVIRLADRYASRYQMALLRANKRPRVWRTR